jgi:hypothetical protein
MNPRRMRGNCCRAGILVLALLVTGLTLRQARGQATEAPSMQPPAGASGQSAAAYQPKFKGDPARSESEALALAYARTLLRAQREYKKRHEKYADTLAALAGTGSFTKRLAQSTERGDYTASFRVHKDGFVFTMTPKHMDSEHRSFYAEDDMIIHADDQKAADSDSPKIK